MLFFKKCRNLSKINKNMFSLKIFRAALTSTNEKLNFDSCPIFQSKLDLGVKSLMTVIKPNSAVTLPINKTQYEAIKQMEKFDNGSVLVLENEKSNKGFFMCGFCYNYMVKI